ncbi:MAG TPA: PspC domain-containing protein [Propionibacteriaceae bacterium]|nr:PspC domain-containing protein [Propionibacteriaceae bacterium]
MNYSTGSLVRPKEGRIIAGVCAGIANAMKVDVSIVRVVVAVAAVVTSGMGLFAYVVAWAVIPDEGSDTTGLDQVINQVKQYKAKSDDKSVPPAGNYQPPQASDSPAPTPQETFNPSAEDDRPQN